MGSVLVSARPCSIENSWSICMNRGSEVRQTKPGTGQFYLFRKIHYSEPHTGSDCLFPDRVFGLQWKCVNTCGIYRYNWVICGNTRFNQEKPCQFSGLLLVTLFGTYFRWFFDRTGLQMPLVTRYCDHVGEMGILCGVVRFF